MRALITGANGQLGRALADVLARAHAQVDTADLPDLDISSMASVEAWLAGHEPYDVVYNCAAFTNVDGCEQDFAAAFAANALGPMNLSIACAKIGATLVHVSTDYVFPGTEPGARTEDDVAAPISAYGRSKLAGEGLALANNPRTHVVRTAWLYGDGRNFVRTMLSLADRFDQITVVDDQLGNPTYAVDLAGELVRIAATKDYGVWHCTNEGTCSWADLAQETFALAGRQTQVVRCTSAEWKQAHPESADRPAFSSLENHRLAKTIGNGMRPWKEALAAYLEAEGLREGVA